MVLVILIVLIILLVTVLSCMWIEAHQNVVYRNEFVLDNLPEAFDGTSLFFISDIHRRIVPDEIIREVKDQAEFVILCGDLMEKGVPFKKVGENIDKLSEIGPIFFVWGNNDYEDDFHKLDALLREKSVVVLDNTAVRLEAAGQEIALLGVDDCGLERDRLDLALKDSLVGFRLLISHNPMIKYQIRPEMGISLVLSGHTHGGQIRLFGWGPREKGGVKEFPGFTLFISNGFGTTSIPLRLGAPAQVHLIKLKRK